MTLNKTGCPWKRLRVGTRVAVKEELDAVRVVVGHGIDGRCLTVYEEPPPWMDRRAYLEDELDLVVLDEAPRGRLLVGAV